MAVKQKDEWLIPGKLGAVRYSINLPDGTTKVGALTVTVSQIERFEGLPEDTEKTFKSRLKRVLDIAEIALNPDHEKVEFPRDVIEQTLNFDDQAILANIWVSRKLSGPGLNPQTDPKWF
jgi:hypothetical protein